MVGSIIAALLCIGGIATGLHEAGSLQQRAEKEMNSNALCSR